MSYADAPHGAHCNSRTFPMRCKYCGEQVFFFTCDHGSKVFFDSLGAPWHVHQCAQYIIAKYGKEVFERGMAQMMMLPGIDRPYRERVEQADVKRKKEPTPIPFLKMEPARGMKTEEYGLISEIVKEVDLFKKLKLGATAMAHGALGVFRDKDYVQITIHTAALGEDENPTFTFLLAKRLLKRADLIKSDFVRCQLVGVQILDRAPLWLCEQIDKV